MATILHVDMDAFFASVEEADNPEYKGKPLVVGSAPDQRGVVSTCNYAARKFGIKSAMPSRTAYALCPNAIFLRPRMSRYAEVSRQIFEIFSHFTPYIEAVSIDEAFLDITGSVHLFGSEVSLAEALRKEVKEKCRVTCSVGIANNRLMAKIGSEEHKPDGLTILPRSSDKIAAFLAPKRISVLWGVGKKTIELLKPYGITHCSDLQAIDETKLAGILASSDGARKLKAYAFGRSDDKVYWQENEEKSVSREHTFLEDESETKNVRAKLLELATQVGRDFRRENRWAKTAKLKLRNAAFETITRQIPFTSPSRDDMAFRAAALELFSAAIETTGDKFASVRLIGFGVSDILYEAPRQIELFLSEDKLNRDKFERLSAVLDDLREKGVVENVYI